ncbi:uncharacterized protein [Amphiura filiformis]|uniref:uncharacterized protein n=1 Tax=Amphiura filiformis TaxID=82378 RepID=UPI003B214B8B
MSQGGDYTIMSMMMYSMLLLALTSVMLNVAAAEVFNKTNTAVRLVESYSDYQGIIEIYDNAEQKWGPVCGNDIGYREAEVICQQLGFSGGYEDYYSDGSDEFGYYDNTYNGYVYVGLSCSKGTEKTIDDCVYDKRRGSYIDCGYQEREFGGVECENGHSSGFSFQFNYFGWIIIIIFVIVVSMLVRRHRMRRLQQRSGQAVSHNVCGGGVVIPPPTNTAYPPPPAGSYPTQQQPPAGSYPTQQQPDLPPQYNALPPKDGSGPYPQYPPPGGAPYPPQAGGAPYAPPPSGAPYPPQAGGAPYAPPQGGAPYPPQGGGTPNPAYPPQGGVAPYPSQAGAPLLQTQLTHSQVILHIRQLITHPIMKYHLCHLLHMIAYLDLEIQANNN